MTRRDRLLLTVLAAVFVLVGSWWFALRPQRAALDRAEADLVAAEDEVASLRIKAADARRARDRYARDYATVARLGKAVPADDDLPALMYQLHASARGAKVDFRSVRVSAGAGAASAPAQTPPAPGTEAAKPAPGAGAAPVPAATAAQTTTAGLPPGAVVGSAGLATMPFSFTFSGSFLAMQGFLDRVQRYVRSRQDELLVQGRLLTIDGIGISAGQQGFPQVQASMTATAYLLPADEGLTAGATSAGPVPAVATTSSP